MTKTSYEHKDILGQELDIGNYVAIAHHNTMLICKIINISVKMIRVVPLKYKKSSGLLVYSKCSVKLSGPDSLAYILQNAGA